MDWERTKEAFVWDGSLLELHVADVDERDWERFYASLRAGPMSLGFSADGSPKPLPNTAHDAFELSPSSTLSLVVDESGLGLGCHFFAPDRLELDFDPRDIRDASDRRRLGDFMRAVGRLLGKPVALTAEGQPERPIVRFDPGRDAFEYDQDP